MIKKRKRLIKELDNIISNIVRQKNKKCFICGETNNLTAGHLISRRIFATRWDLKNIEVQCKKCNFLHEHRPEIFIYKYIKSYGCDAFLKLVEASQEKRKFSNKDLKTLLSYFKQKEDKND